MLRIEFFVNSLKNEKYVTKRKYLEEKLWKKNNFEKKIKPTS